MHGQRGSPNAASNAISPRWSPTSWSDTATTRPSRSRPSRSACRWTRSTCFTTTRPGRLVDRQSSATACVPPDRALAEPEKIVELNTIRRLVEDGELVICCGGGGVPVIQEADGLFRGAAAVIDKDRTSALLARELNAKSLIILTAVDRVCLNYGKPNQKALDRITVDEAKDYLKAGHFAEGSMRPKIEAAIDFVEGSADPDAYALIAELPR
ncbi:MAG: hypothetical protein R3C45_13180 [Phycisphaerales bacterium]